MTRVEEPSVAVHDDTPPPPRWRRRPELWLAGIGMAAAAVLQGGFTLAVSRSDDTQLRDTILPALTSAGVQTTTADAVEVLQTLAAWFGLSLVVMAGLFAVGAFIASRRPRRRSTGWWFLAAGLVCLIGTQFVLYPIAFLFFLAAGLFAVRTPHPRSTS